MARSQQIPEGVFTVTIHFIYKDCPEQTLNLRIHKSRDVADLFTRTKTWLETEFNYSESSGQQFVLVYKGANLDSKQSLKESGIESDSKVFVNMISKDDNLPKKVKEEKEDQAMPKQEGPAPPERLPKAPK